VINRKMFSLNSSSLKQHL